MKVDKFADIYNLTIPDRYQNSIGPMLYYMFSATLTTLILLCDI